MICPIRLRLSLNILSSVVTFDTLSYSGFIDKIRKKREKGKKRLNSF